MPKDLRYLINRIMSLFHLKKKKILDPFLSLKVYSLQKRRAKIVTSLYTTRGADASAPTRLYPIPDAAFL